MARAVHDPTPAALALGEARALLIEAESDRPGWNLVQEMLAGLEQIAGNQAAAISRLQQARLLGDTTGRPAPVRVATWPAGRLATLRSENPGGNTVRQ